MESTRPWGHFEASSCWDVCLTWPCFISPGGAAVMRGKGWGREVQTVNSCEMAQSVLLHWESVLDLPSSRPWLNSLQDSLSPIVLCLFKANTAQNMHVLKRVCSLHRNVLAHGFGPESTQMSLLSFLPLELSHTWQMLSVCCWTSLPALPLGVVVIPAHKYRTQSVSSSKGPIKITVLNSLLLTEPPTAKPESGHLLSAKPFLMSSLNFPDVVSMHFHVPMI